ncbi:hypothetical protein [Solitalea canadensis]|uniref:DUF1772 domain-containing protein n=1 Tax=Solitalea canadensis (strain ATCC 29591 / DSM 3403 / JCM 21819 / LMG 8368 / NBRC 15130 / NCIMB 12057 / USAM 9D) TaxID=929556 RepID=H8KTY5_SOLCM|nr:hypothetical protein [Solitalea canadensis]AFD06835.1 hypothetical protein Solca_1769 [Solitalea canadensis DSM 3403]
MKTKLATPILIVCALLLAIGNGTGVYEHLFGLPKMLSTVTSLNETIHSTTSQPQKFWIPLHAMIFITLILSMVMNWKNEGRKKLILTVFISYLYISIVSIVFAKMLFTFPDITDAGEFAKQTHRWILLSWHRPLIGLAGAILLMIAISRPALTSSKSS